MLFRQELESHSSDRPTRTTSRPSANTAQEGEFDDELCAILCEAYFGRADEALLARMRLQALMSDMVGTLWAAIQEQISAIDYDFWSWATLRWDRAVAIMDSPGFREVLRAVAGA